MNENLNCDHSNESILSSVFSNGAVYYAIQDSSNLGPVNEMIKCDHSNEQCFLVVLFRRDEVHGSNF